MLILGTVWIGTAQEKSGPRNAIKAYEPTENQRLRLELQQARFTLALEHFRQAEAAFNGEVKAIEKENGWPEDLQFDPNTLAFKEFPRPPAAPASNHGPASPPVPMDKPTGPPVEPAAK
jgi:hypothetical protein